MSNIRLVAADIDLTLEQFMKPFPKINRKALEDLHAQGIMVALASGRSVRQLRDKYRQWKLSFEPDLLIGVNGSAMYDRLNDSEDKLLLFEKEWIKELIAFLDEYKYAYYAYIDDYTLFRNKDKYFLRIAKLIDRDVRLAKTEEDFCQGDFYKFLLRLEKDEVPAFLKQIGPLLERHKDHFKLLMTTKDSYEIVHAKTSKAYALKRFCERHDISLADVAAFGDADNDNEMIEAAGMGVCLKNGMETTKTLADYITDLDCVEGGFGDFVYKHILK